MTVAIKPQWQKFIDDQVKAGYFRSADEVLEAGLARLMLDPEPITLDEKEILRINAALGRIDGGEGIDAKVVHAQLLRRFGNKQ